MRNVVGTFQNVTFPLSLPEIQRIRLGCSPRDPGGVRGGKTQGSVKHPWGGAWRVTVSLSSCPLSSSSSAPKLPLKGPPPSSCSGGFCSKQVGLGHVPLHLPFSWDISLCCDLNSLRCPRLHIDFQVFFPTFFIFVKMGVVTSKLFICQSSTRKSGRWNLSWILKDRHDFSGSQRDR